MLKRIKRTIGWTLAVIRRWELSFVHGLGFALICFVLLNAAMEPVTKNVYCGTTCHEMNTAYQSWETSVHGANARGIQVGCIQCHLPPREDYFAHLFAKAWAGGKDMYMHHFGPEYDGEAMSHEVAGKVSNEMCAHCHNDLLIKPASAKSRFAHQAAQLEPDKSENKCITCHEQAGHKRNATLFSP